MQVAEHTDQSVEKVEQHCYLSPFYTSFGPKGFKGMGEAPPCPVTACLKKSWRHWRPHPHSLRLIHIRYRVFLKTVVFVLFETMMFVLLEAVLFVFSKFFMIPSASPTFFTLSLPACTTFFAPAAFVSCVHSKYSPFSRMYFAIKNPPVHEEREIVLVRIEVVHGFPPPYF